VTAAIDVDATTSQHLISHRRYLHAIPELAFKEVETAHYLAERLESLSPDRLDVNVGGTGVVADFEGAQGGRSVLLRADIDGLPIEEAGNLDYRSRFRGAMHACGHDVHMAIALEVARLIADSRPQLPGRIRVLFQPAEEIGGGAKRMIEAGVLDGIDRVIGLHVWSELPVGLVSIRPDVVMASGDFSR
jgi:amidohydrolase